MSTTTTQDADVESILEQVAHELDISEEEALRESLRTLLNRHLREVQSEIFEIAGRYGVSSVEDMEEHYRRGTLEEADSWRDLQRLDHLEYRQDRLQQLLNLLP